MRSFRYLCMIIAAVFAGIVIATNVGMHRNKEKNDKYYRVEIARLVSRMEQARAGVSDNTTTADTATDIAATDIAVTFDPSDYQYVTAVIPCENDADLTGISAQDYCIRQIGDELYRIEYRADVSKDWMTTWVNISFGIVAVLLLAVLWYVRRRIIQPFHRLEQVPLELAKGNLTADIPEEKTKYFHRFVWGTNMLRENLKERREKELNMHRDKKLLLLSLTHDIKTPLSVIKLNTQALQRHLYEDSERQEKALNDIVGKVDEIEQYVTQIVAASKEDFIDLSVKQEEFYLQNLLDRVREYYAGRMELRKTEFVISEYHNCLLAADLSRSEEILQNLIENAMKYGDGRYVRITVGEEEGCALITVTNSGNSLNPDECDKIFDSFYRGSNVGNQPGSGLGLYICRQLARNMNGEIFARCREDEFSVTVVVPMC